MKLKDNIPVIAVTAFLLLSVGMIVSRFVTPTADAVSVAVKVPDLTPVARSGKRAFDDNCAACHGVNGAGTDQGPPLVHSIYNPGHHADASFLAAAQRGVPRHHWNFGDMPAQPQVSRRQIEVIIRYVRELQEANGIFYKRHMM